MNLDTILALTAFLPGFVIVLYTMLKYERLARFIPVNRLGVIERDLSNLRRVIVVADRVEKPSGVLADAVEDNFKERVKYLFLVSNKRAQQEINGYFLIFRALAQKTAAEMDSAVAVQDLVEIKKLTFDWPEVPYIFYQYAPASVETLTIAFRGNQKGEGIADEYEQLTDSRSQAIASALLAEAPEEIRANLKVVPYSASTQLAGQEAI